LAAVAAKRGGDAVFSLMQAEQQHFKPVDPVDEPEDIEGYIRGQMLQGVPIATETKPTIFRMTGVQRRSRKRW
jgi:hypothetical protein